MLISLIGLLYTVYMNQILTVCLVNVYNYCVSVKSQGWACGLVVKMPTARAGVALVPTSDSSSHLAANADLRRSSDGSGSGVPAAHMGNVGQVPSSQLQSQPGAISGIGGMNQKMGTSFLSVSLPLLKFKQLLLLILKMK